MTMDVAGRVVRGDVLVVGGAIAGIGRVPRPPRGARVLDASGCVVLPGLVQTHVHLCQTLFRGLCDDRPLLAWLRERIWPLEAAHDARSVRASARLGLLELLLGGTTTILDMGTVRHQDEVFLAMREAGIRGSSGKAMMDRGDGVSRVLRERTRASLDETEALARRWHGRGRLGYAVAPRFLLSATRALLEGARDLALRRGLLLHTHASEHPDECAAVRRETGKDNVAALHALGLTGPRSVFAHCVHVTPKERTLLARTRTAVAHCPSANLKLGSGIADVVALREGGVTVGLGADGAPCNNLLDAWSEMRLAGLLAAARRGPGALRAADVLAMATRDGARALGLGASIGSIELGKRADLVVVEPGLGGEPGADLAGRLVWSGRAADVRDVVIDGEIVVRNRRCLTLDEERVRAEARTAAKRVASRAGI